MVRRASLLLVPAVVLWAAGGCGKKAGRVPADPDQLPFIAGNPWNAYCANEADAERTYKGKRVEVSGTIIEVRKKPDKPMSVVLVLKMTPQVKDLSNDVILIQIPTSAEVDRLKAWNSRIKLRATVLRFEAGAKVLHLGDGRLMQIGDRDGNVLWTRPR